MTVHFSQKHCVFDGTTFPSKKIVLTGGPGAGKTAILELARRHFCQNVLVIPEAAGIIFGGGFLRLDSLPGRRAAQRAIYYVQREYERMVHEDAIAPLILCDRGSIDGAAYWPGTASEFFAELETTEAEEYGRYDAVIHLRTPSLARGFNNQNPLRVETAQEAARIDQHILEVWQRHPKRIIIESTDDFLLKANRTLTAIRSFFPLCCQSSGTDLGQS